jgi:GH25 family lysozyme M1 (1,4-beta-N-acetylmuramidase)
MTERPLNKMKRTITLALGIVAAVALTTSVQANNVSSSDFGIDVSHYQGYVTWSSVKANGADFAYAQATAGTATTDADFSGNMSRGKGAGMQMGAYHFTYPSEGCPSVQASHFWNVAGSTISSTDGKTVEPMVDCEEFTGLGNCGEGSYTIWYNDWRNDLQGHTSIALRPVIYVSACNACNLNSGITMGSWIANYNGQNLRTGNPWSTCCSCNVWGGGCGANTWTFWQVSASGSIGGVSGACDFDAYNGNLTELKSWQGV